jgi:hypothetical protein
MADRADRDAPRPTDEISRATDEDRDDITGSDADEFDDVDDAAAGDDEDDENDLSDR